MPVDPMRSGASAPGPAPVIAIGLGLRQATPAPDLCAALADFLAEAADNLPDLALSDLAQPDLALPPTPAAARLFLALPAQRAQHPGRAALARRWPGLRQICLPAGALAGIATPSHSPGVAARYGCGALCEALAIALAAGPLRLPKRIIGRQITLALACGPGAPAHIPPFPDRDRSIP